MLTMTDTAAEAVKTIVQRAPQTDATGVRIRDAGGETGFELTLAASPEPEDTVVDAEGARVYLDESAAVALDDRVLDAELTQDGAVRFALSAQQ